MSGSAGLRRNRTGKNQEINLQKPPARLALPVLPRLLGCHRLPLASIAKDQRNASGQVEWGDWILAM